MVIIGIRGSDPVREVKEVICKVSSFSIMDFYQLRSFLSLVALYQPSLALGELATSLLLGVEDPVFNMRFLLETVVAR